MLVTGKENKKAVCSRTITQGHNVQVLVIIKPVTCNKKTNRGNFDLMSTLN